LSMEELRVVARYAVEAAQEVLPFFEERHPNDRRARAAVERRGPLLRVRTGRSCSTSPLWMRTGPRRTRPMRQRSMRHMGPATPPPPRTCTRSPRRPRSATFCVPLRMQHARLSWPPTAIQTWETSTLSRLVSVRRLLSLTCSGATPSRQPARAVSRSS
jgi:hypothetical protein